MLPIQQTSCDSSENMKDIQWVGTNGWNPFDDNRRYSTIYVQL
jgi:hypothetical protein